MFCCFSGSKSTSDFKHKFEVTDNGLKVEITTDNKEKAEALKNLIDSCSKLCNC